MNSIIRLIVGQFTTLEHEGVKKILNSVNKAEDDFQQAINSGALMRHDKERKALAEDAATLLGKYVTDAKVDDKGTVTDAGGEPTAKFEKELMPFSARSELIGAINHALDEDTSAFVDFDTAWPRVIAYARRRTEKDLFSNKKSLALARPWEGTPEEGGLNWAWGPVLEAIEQGQDPNEVRNVTKLRVNSVADGLRDLNLIRVAAAVRGLRKVLAEVRKTLVELKSKAEMVALFDEVTMLQSDLKRAGQGRSPDATRRLEKALGGMFGGPVAVPQA